MAVRQWKGSVASTSSAPWQNRVFSVLAVVLAGIMAVFLIIPFIALIWRAVTLEGHIAASELSIASAVALSLGTTAVTIVFIVILGTPLAYFLARHQFPLKRLLTLFIEMPIVMPPVVAGLALLSAFGRRGLIGAPLASLNISVTFTLTAVILAQLFVSSPFYIRSAQSRFESLPREYEDAAAVDGASRWVIFWRVILPQSTRALLTGLILSWARALGEFGATILFAGNLQGRTQTLPLLVYGALEQDLRVTFVTALILLALAVLAFSLTRWLTGLDDYEGDTPTILG
ncbi:MAG: molybdate ABC transporter permease subunit [Ardenticatenaceae bacterium]|nr:molybdate ABC transporter permease subunit [Ardenticatenaceae bacterium]